MDNPECQYHSGAMQHANLLSACREASVCCCRDTAPASFQSGGEKEQNAWLRACRGACLPHQWVAQPSTLLLPHVLGEGVATE